MQFALYYEQKKIGTVFVEKQGLFYKISCRFSFTNKSRVKLYVLSSNQYIEIGQCSNYGEKWGLEKWIAVKHIGNDIKSFCVMLENTDNVEKVEAGKPFLMLERLTEAYLDVGVHGMFVRFGDV